MDNSPYEKIFLLTDGCMWEINHQSGNEHPHSIEVVDIETGAVRYIKSGSFIAFVEGEITDVRTQAGYNKAQKKKEKDLRSHKKEVLHRKTSQDPGKKTL